MRNFNHAARVAAVPLTLAIAAGAGACGGEVQPASSPLPSVTVAKAAAEGNIANDADQNNHTIGASAYDAIAQGSAPTGAYAHGQQLRILCVAKGVQKVDRNVPPGQQAITFSDYYKTDTVPESNFTNRFTGDWYAGKPYVTLAPDPKTGAAPAVPAC
jgi:hypothetical protein